MRSLRDSLRVASDRLSRVELSRRTSDGGEQRIVIERGEGPWRITHPITYRANDAAVEPIVAALAEIEIIGRIPWHEAAATNRGLRPEASIEVKAWDGDRLASHFRVGRSNRDETSVWRGGKAPIEVVRGRCRPIFDKNLDALRYPVITDLRQDQVDGVEYANQYGRLELIRDPAAPKTFIPKGAKLRNFNAARATKNVGVLAHLMANGFVDAPFDREATGLFEPTTPRATLLLGAPGFPHRIDVWVGARTVDGRIHVRTSASEQVYLTSAHLMSSLVVRRSQLERSDEEMRQIRAHRERDARHREGHPGAAAPTHRHGGPAELPNRVPPEILNELRSLAREQQGP